MRSISVKMANVEQVANKMEEMVISYKQSYNQLFDEVDLLKSSWQGKDNMAFSNAISAYEDDFNQMYILIWQYIEFLRASAKAYTNLQDELTQSVTAL